MRVKTEGLGEKKGVTFFVATMQERLSGGWIHASFPKGRNKGLSTPVCRIGGRGKGSTEV